MEGKKIRYADLAKLRPKMLKEIANTWIGEDGWRKVHLSIIVIRGLKQGIGNGRGTNRTLLKLHKDPTEKKKGESQDNLDRMKL